MEQKMFCECVVCGKELLDGLNLLIYKNNCFCSEDCAVLFIKSIGDLKDSILGEPLGKICIEGQNTPQR